MKKIATFMISTFIAALSAVPVSASADDYTVPSCWFSTVQEEDGTVIIDRKDFTGDDFTLNINVYVKDEMLLSYFVSPKWKCASEYIKIRNLADPQQQLIPYAYAQTNDSGEIVKGNYSVITSIDEELNIAAFTVRTNLFDTSGTLVPYGETTDAYPLTSFDAVISSDIPVGEYGIYFLTKTEDYDDQRISEIAMRNTGFDGIPEIENLVIKVVDTSENVKFGDVNEDGIIDASDASETLAIYSEYSTGNFTERTPTSLIAANVNGDEVIDSSDASAILTYYSYLSIGGTLDIKDFLAESTESGEIQE